MNLAEIAPNDVKLFVIMKNVLACWYFLINFFYVVRQSYACQVHLKEIKTVTLNYIRLRRLFEKIVNCVVTKS